MAEGIETWRGMAHPWNCDTMGHMNTRFYAAIYDDASFHFLARLAPSRAQQESGLGWADVRQLIEYKQEVAGGALLLVRTVLKRLGRTSVEYRHELHDAETDLLHSTSEQVTVRFDLAAQKAAPLDEEIRRRGAALQP